MKEHIEDLIVTALLGLGILAFLVIVAVSATWLGFWLWVGGA